ncbi:MAG: L-threonylcarbamoyladenylate synthase type 1 TsaC, partial [Deltaproteobacteria bacterium]
PEGDLGYAAVEVLSERGDLVEAAYRLFSALRRLDRAGVEVIYAERVPEVGLGRAIMDRLRKAANKFEGDWG